MRVLFLALALAGCATEGPTSSTIVGSPAETALAYVGDVLPDAELSVASVAPAGDGALVTLERTAQGLPIAGGRIVVRLDADGAVRWTTVLREIATPAIATPTIDADRAVGLVMGDPSPQPSEPSPVAHDDVFPPPNPLPSGGGDVAALPSGGGEIDASDHAELVLYADPTFPAARLAWHVVVEDAVRPVTYRAYVDATSGVVYAREDRTHRSPRHRARVFPVDPVRSMERLEEVVFSELPDDATSLDDGRVRVLNCIDRRTCQAVKTSAGERRVHHCELVPTAAPGPDGSFLHIGRGRDDDPEDPFAEVQAYAHVHTALAAFRRFRGDDAFALRAPLTTIVNMRPPDLRSDVSICDGDRAPRASRLRIEENAYFWPAGGLGPVAIGDRVVLHQGALADWAYDGEVVFHETTHAVMNTTTPLAWHHLDARGFDMQGGALHEAFSDYFAGAISGNTELSPYAGRTEEGPAPTNSLASRTRCDDVLDGEEHAEGEAWAGALWALRTALRSQVKRAMLDGALARVISAIGQFDGFEEVYPLVLAELEVASEELITRERLSSRDAASLRAIVGAAPDHFAARGLPGCGGRAQALELGVAKPQLYLYGPNTLGADTYRSQLIPAPMQIAIDVPFATDAIQVSASRSWEYDDTMKSGAMKDDPEIVALLRKDEPVTWRWTLPRGEHDASAEGVIEVARSRGRRAVGEIRGHFAPGRYYLQLANRGADWVLADLVVLVANEEGEFVDGKTDDGAGPGPTVRAEGCSAAPSRSSGLALLALVAAFAALRRRPVS